MEQMNLNVLNIHTQNFECKAQISKEQSDK